MRREAFRHGLVDQITLVRMATEGRLRPEDLVWCKAGGDGWHLAGSVAELCPPPPQPQGPSVVAASDMRFRRHLLTVPLLVATGALLIAATSWVANRLHRHEIEPDPRLARLFGIEVAQRSPADFRLQADLIELYIEQHRYTDADKHIAALARRDGGQALAARYRQRLNDVQEAIRLQEELTRIYAQATAYLESELPDKAAPLITHLAGDDSWRTQADDLARRAQALRERWRLERRFKDLLRSGGIHAGNAAQETRVYHENKALHDLDAVLVAVLRERAALPPAASLGVAHVYWSLERRESVAEALRQFQERSGPAMPEAQALNVVWLLKAIGRQAQGTEFLVEHVKANPGHVLAEIELAARLAETGDTKAALNHLREAIRNGGNAARRQALGDARFEAVRGTWTFRRLTRMD